MGRANIRTDFVEVHLPFSDFILASAAALERMADSRRQKLNHAKSVKRTLDTRLNEETPGCIGEIAIARLCDDFEFVPSLNTFHEIADYSQDLEIRASVVAGARLIFRDDEPRDRRYVLFTVQYGDDRVKAFADGWLYGHEAQQTKYLDNPGGTRESYFVPKDALRPMATLELRKVTGEIFTVQPGFYDFTAVARNFSAV